MTGACFGLRKSNCCIGLALEKEKPAAGSLPEETGRVRTFIGAP